MTQQRKYDYMLIATIVIALMSFIVSAYAGYTSNDKVTSGRITALESQQQNDRESIIRIENRVDKANDKLDRLVEWALGKQP